MNNLSERVERAKKLKWFHTPCFGPRCYSTRGCSDDAYYYINLSSAKEEIVTPDGNKTISIFKVTCQKNIGTGRLYNCPGNERHNTVCYHSLGALYESFRKCDKLISFFDTYESANRMAFGGKVVKVKSLDGGGFLWATFKPWPKSVLSVEININLMRGSEEEEGID